jgi:hypothetical protein
MKDPKTDACVYILTCMLQRLEIVQPGYLAELISGVESDRSQLPADLPDRENLDSVFSETLTILKRAEQQLVDNRLEHLH